MPKRPKPEPESAETPGDTALQKLIGRRLKAIRKLGGIKQTEISELLTVDQSTWSKWEGGKRMPDLFKMVRFAARAQTSLDLIYRGLPVGTNPILLKLLRAAQPDLVAPESPDSEPSTDTALAAYRSAIRPD